MSHSTITPINVNEEAGKKSKRVATQTQQDSKRSKKLPLGDVEKSLCEWIDQKKTPLIPVKVTFDAHFGVWRPDTGEPQILGFDLQRKVMRLCSADEMAGVLADQVHKIRKDDFRISFSQAREVVKRWKMCGTRKIAEWPKPVGFKSSDGMFFSRLSFDPISNSTLSNFPIIAEILGRMSHADRFCQILGSCFSPTASRKQALWLHGESNSGKSFLLNNVVSKLCGGKAGTATFSGEALKGSHWKEPLIGKSLLVVNEASANFLTSDAFLSLGGDDLHMINPKGLKMFQGHLDCRIFFSSNEAPKMPNKQEIKNRVVECRITAFKGKMIIPSQLELLIDHELPYFVAYCMEQYARLEGNSIQSDSEDLELAISDHEAELQFTFDRCFVASAKSSITAYEFSLHLDPYLDSRRGITLPKMREFVRTQYGIECGKLTKLPGGKVARLYVGMRIKQ